MFAEIYFSGFSNLSPTPLVAKNQRIIDIASIIYPASTINDLVFSTIV